MVLVDSIGHLHLWGERNYKYRIEKDNIVFSFFGDDLTIELWFSVDENRALINLNSTMPYRIPRKARNDIALAVCAVNWMLGDGDFDFDYLNGIICFRITSVYRDSIISKQSFEYMLRTAASTIERFNDKFFYLSQGKMTLEELALFMVED